MSVPIPDQTIKAFARSIVHETRNYGFTQVDIVRLINALVDTSVDPRHAYQAADTGSHFSKNLPIDDPRLQVTEFPLRGVGLTIRESVPDSDLALLDSWLTDRYGQHFVLSCATAHRADARSLFANPDNIVGIVLDEGETPIGAVAYLGHDRQQRRAELRKLIGVPAARGRGYAEQATALWLKYGIEQLGLEKVFVSTLQNHLRNIQLNEAVGFRVEGVLIDEVLIDGKREDVLRMGFCVQRRDGDNA